MFTVVNDTFDTIISRIPADWKVLDVGAATAPTRRADYLIDIVPFSEVRLSEAKGPGAVRFSADTYIRRDIGDRGQWPFSDKFFDYVICSHTLEDVRDPIAVLGELTRIAKAGYIEVPSRAWETSYGIEGMRLAGAVHHRWIIDVVGTDTMPRLRFTFKYSWVHLPWVAHHRPPRGGERVLQIEWQESVDYYENFLNSGTEIIRYLTGHTEPAAIQEFYRKLWRQSRFTAKLIYWYRTVPWFRTWADRLNIVRLYRSLKKI